jgi:hypothetical protein
VTWSGGQVVASDDDVGVWIRLAEPETGEDQLRPAVWAGSDRSIRFSARGQESHPHSTGSLGEAR